MAEIMERVALVVLGAFVVVAGAASSSPHAFESGLAVTAFGLVLLARLRRRQAPRAVLISTGAR